MGSPDRKEDLGWGYRRRTNYSSDVFENVPRVNFQTYYNIEIRKCSNYFEEILEKISLKRSSHLCSEITLSYPACAMASLSAS